MPIANLAQIRCAITLTVAGTDAPPTPEQLRDAERKLGSHIGRCVPLEKLSVPDGLTIITVAVSA